MIGFPASIFGAALILGTLSTIDAAEPDYTFTSVIRTGRDFDWPHPEPKLIMRRIAAGRCDGGLDYQNDFYCTDLNGLKHPPFVLQVEVQDHSGRPDIRVSTDLEQVSIYRVACQGGALIKIRHVCPMY